MKSYPLNRFDKVNGIIRLRLTDTDPLLAEEFQLAKERMAQGWGIKIEFEK